MKPWLVIAGFALYSLSALGVDQEIIFRGGIVYYRLVTDACPPLSVSRGTFPNSFVVKNESAVCLPVIPKPQAERLFVLGPLSPGTYQIFFGTIVPPAAITFTISENSDRTITNYTVTADGRGSFHILGVGETSYIIQSSEDMISWNDVVTLTGDSDYTEPQSSMIKPLCYRVRIEAPPPNVNP